MTTSLAALYLKELEAEAPATRACLERLSPNLADWKPHEKSMPLGYLSLVVAEIPRWITTIVTVGEIDFGTWKQEKPALGAPMVAHFEENMAGARKALAGVSDEAFDGNFELKMKGKVLMSTPKGKSVSESINHLVHHRGQLTVYMRLNNILVP